MTTLFHNIDLEGALNTRDIGGYPTNSGRVITPNLLFRSSELSYLTLSDIEKLQQKNITTIVDFRGLEEAEKAPDQCSKETKIVHSPIIGDHLDMDKARQYIDESGLPKTFYNEDLINSYGPFYRMLTLVNSYNKPDYLEKLAGYRSFFQQLLIQPTNEALLFHCTGGRDRTGVATALLLYVLGVPKPIIFEDYLVSNQNLQPDADQPNSTRFELFRFSNVFIQPLNNLKFQQVAKDLETTPEKIYDAIKLKPQYINDLFNNIIQLYGSIESFLEEKLSITVQDRLTLQKKYTTASSVKAQCFRLPDEE